VVCLSVIIVAAAIGVKAKPTQYVAALCLRHEKICFLPSSAALRDACLPGNGCRRQSPAHGTDGFAGSIRTEHTKKAEPLTSRIPGHLADVLARFAASAAVTINIAGVLACRFFLDRTGDVAYDQLVLTYPLTISDLVLVIPLRPPARGFTPAGLGSGEQRGDWRPTAMVLVLLSLLFAAALIPLAEEIFGLKP
jgi:hypothetical protein